MQTSKHPVAVAYLRVSTDKQGRSGLGLADQKRAIDEFCARRGLSIAAEFTEIESGKNDDRPQLAKALSVARRRSGILVTATISRLGRRVSFVSALMEQSVPFVCADAPDDDAFILHVKAAFAEEERRKISSRTKAALAVAKSRGVRLGTPANLTIDARRRGAQAVRARALVEQAAMRPEIDAARAEGLSVRAIAERVGISPSTVARLLRAS